MRVRRAASFALAPALVGLLATAPLAADAQSVTGSRINRNEAGATGSYLSRSGASERAGFLALGRCTAELFEPAARQALTYPYGGEEQGKAIDRVLDQARWRSDRCFSADRVETSGHAASYAGAFAEFFVRHRFGRSRVDALMADQSERWAAARPTPRNGDEHLSSCIVASSGPQIYTLLESEPDTKEEATALAPLLDALSPCITQGQEVTFNRSGLRSLLAVSLYQALNEHREYRQDAG